jgi:hypothetical protein
MIAAKETKLGTTLENMEGTIGQGWVHETARDTPEQEGGAAANFLWPPQVPEGKGTKKNCVLPLGDFPPSSF